MSQSPANKANAQNNLNAVKNFGGQVLNGAKQVGSDLLHPVQTMQGAGQELGYLGNKAAGAIKNVGSSVAKKAGMAAKMGAKPMLQNRVQNFMNGRRAR